MLIRRMKNKGAYSRHKKICIYCLALLFIAPFSMKFINMFMRSEVVFPLDVIVPYMLCCSVTYLAIMQYNVGIYLLSLLLAVFGGVLTFFMFEPSLVQIGIGISWMIASLVLLFFVTFTDTSQR